MTMRRHDFNEIAEIIRVHKISKGYLITDLREIANDLAIYFKKNNPSFDRSRWFKACGWYDE